VGARLPIDPDLERNRQPDVLAAIALGGFIGTVGRYELGLAWKPPAGGFPWATFTINTSGALLLGLILTLVLERLGPTRYVRAFFCVGVLGAWTTMSTFAVESDLLIKDGHLTTALAYAAATVCIGLAATWLGTVIARKFDVNRLAWSSR
jgi:CrcB protein